MANNQPDNTGMSVYGKYLEGPEHEDKKYRKLMEIMKKDKQLDKDIKEKRFPVPELLQRGTALSAELAEVAQFHDTIEGLEATLKSEEKRGRLPRKFNIASDIEYLRHKAGIATKFGIAARFVYVNNRMNVGVTNDYYTSLMNQAQDWTHEQLIGFYMALEDKPER